MIIPSIRLANAHYENGLFAECTVREKPSTFADGLGGMSSRCDSSGSACLTPASPFFPVILAVTVRSMRDAQGKVSGAVLIFRDITHRRQTERECAAARAYAESIVETVREPLVILDADLRVQSASRSFYRTFHVTREETTGRQVYELDSGQWEIPALRELLEKILPQNTAFDDYLVAVTGYGQEEDRRNAPEAGFDDHITKPVAKNQLESLLVTFPHLQLSFAASGSLV